MGFVETKETGGRTREERLSTSISMFRSNVTKMSGVDEYTRKDLQALSDPSKKVQTDKWLTTEGRSFYLPANDAGKKAGEQFAKELQNLGYAAILLRGTGSESSNYIIYVGKQAIDVVSNFAVGKPPTDEQRKSLESFLKSAPSIFAICEKNGYDSTWAVNLASTVQRIVPEAAPSEETTVASVPAPVQKPAKKPQDQTYEEILGLGEKAPRGTMGVSEAELGLVPAKPKIAARLEHPSETLSLPVPEKKPGKAEQAKIDRLEKQLEEELKTLRENSEPWKATGRSKIAQAYYFLNRVRDQLAKEGNYTSEAGEPVDRDILLFGEGKNEGRIVRNEKAIKEVQDAYAKALEIVEKLHKLGADVGPYLEELESLNIKIGQEVLTYQSTPVKVKALDGGYNLYAAKKEKGKTAYAFYDVEEPAQPLGVAPADRDRYISMLYTQGLNDSTLAYKQARETLVNNLTSTQLELVLNYAQGKTDSLSLKVDPAKQGAVERAIVFLCNVNGFKGPSFEVLSEKGKIEASGRVSAIQIPEESMKRLKEWAGPYLSEAEMQAIATRFSYEDISKMIDFIDRARLAFSQGREPMEYLSAEQGVFAPKGGLDMQTARALNALFLYAGGLSVAFYENAGYIYSTGPTMYTEPEVMKFEFPVKISHKEGKRERWLRMERVPEKEKQIEQAINSGKGGEIQFGKLFKENPEDARLYAIHKRQAEIVVGYLNAQGIRATLEEFQKTGGYFGIKIIIPENAMGIGEVQRKPRKVEVTEASLLEAGPAKVDPLRAINNLPEDIANSKMKASLLGGVKKGEETAIRCASEEQATRMRNWLIMNGGIPAEKLEIQATQATRQVESAVPGQTTKATKTEWILVYYPEPVTKYSFRELEPRGKKEPVHPTLYQRDLVTKKRGAEMKSELEEQAEAYEKANPEKDVTVEFSPVGGSRKKDPSPKAAENFHNESVFGDAFLGIAFEFAWRTEQDTPRAPLVGGDRRFRDVLETSMGLATEDGRFRHGEEMAKMMLREWRHPGMPLSGQEEKAASDAYFALEQKYANMEEFAKGLTPENAMKFTAAANWLAERWLSMYDTKGMKAEEVEALRSSLREVAWKSMVVLVTLESSPAHFGVGPGTERPKNPQEHLTGALFYMGMGEIGSKEDPNTFTAKDGTKYSNYFVVDGVQYNILARRVLTPGPDPGHYVTLPSKDPSKVILYGKLKQRNVQLPDGRWIPAYEVEVLSQKERKVMDRDSLGEGSFTPEYTGPLPYAKIRIGEKPPKGGKVKGKVEYYELSYEGMDVTDVKFPGKQPKPYVGVLVTSKKKGEKEAGPGPEKADFVNAETEFVYSVVMRIGEDEETQRYLALTAESEKNHADELSTKHKLTKVSAVAELAADGNIYVYKLGDKIIDAKWGSFRFKETKRVEVGERNRKGEIESSIPDFTAEELASMPGIIEEDGTLYLDITREKIGTYTLSKEGRKGMEREKASISLDSSKEEKYGDIVRTVLTGKEISAAATFTPVSVTREEGEEPEVKPVDRAKSNATLVSVPVTVAPSVRALGLADEYYSARGGFPDNKRPTYYVVGESVKK